MQVTPTKLVNSVQFKNMILIPKGNQMFFATWWLDRKDFLYKHNYVQNIQHEEQRELN